MTSEERSSSDEGNGEERRSSTESADRRRRTDGETMADVSHTHPYADRGTVNRPFERGPTIAADGGRRGAAERPSNERASAEDADEESSGVDDETMADVDHTPPGDAPSADGVFERGNERGEP
ncbi:hypothetical protein [Halomicrococcus sp. NG-SE-24]|uniref:hypothetical protein n=1 Tax=Halomicrococcus sp. NG-SE-24 TaxID=3436928 RepID=UPI003D97D8AF